VKTLKEYRIPYLGLKQGVHQYQFRPDRKFFEEFEYSEIHDCDLVADVELEKQSTMLVIHVNLQGSVATTCDHCGDDLTIQIATKQQLIVKFGEETGNTDEDILVLGPSEHEVDLSQYIFEYAHLALPARHVHENEKDCNQEALKRLAAYKVDTTANTKWAALKNLNYEDPEDNEFFNEEEEE
jgi:uncharacterized metal-binding protein YceD (DUF177 family)